MAPMGIAIDPGQAWERLEQAVFIARSTTTLPEWWQRNARIVGDSPRSIDTVILGCALLAKSCDARIDPFVIKLGETERGYNMRTIGDLVLAKARQKYGFDLGSTSPNPTNSSTYLRPRSLHDVRPRHKASYESLMRVLEEVDNLDEDQALLALAAWIRVRIGVAAANQPVRIAGTTSDLANLLEACRTFIQENSEGGARGQALVAAACSLVWPKVVTGKINDPSRHWPGDVHAFQPSISTPVMAAEVKQRVVDDGEVMDFIYACTSRGIDNVVYAALHPHQEWLESINPEQIAAEYNCVFTWLQSIDTVVLSALAWSPRDVGSKLQDLVEGVLERLREVGLSAATQRRWAELTDSQIIS